MICLLLDTSCPRGVVALSTSGRLLAKRYLLETKQHSEALSPCVHEVLAEAQLTMNDLTLVAVGKGPGSFIGVRIAVAYAKGLCVALNIPLVGIGTLSAIAHEPGLPSGKGVAVIDARRGEYYVQSVERDAEGHVVEVDSPHLYPAADLGHLVIRRKFATGTSLRDYEGGGLTTVHPIDGPSAEGMVGALGARLLQISDIVDETESLIPEYVRDPDAKPMLVK